MTPQVYRVLLRSARAKTAVGAVDSVSHSTDTSSVTGLALHVHNHDTAAVDLVAGALT